MIAERRRAGDIPVTLLVDEGGRADLAAVLRRARRAGLRHGEVLEAVGIITGVAAADTIDDLARVRGVEAAEGERTFRLPPPDQPQ